jgi:hypothetical protein
VSGLAKLRSVELRAGAANWLIGLPPDQNGNAQADPGRRPDIGSVVARQRSGWRPIEAALSDVYQALLLNA